LCNVISNTLPAGAGINSNTRPGNQTIFESEIFRNPELQFFERHFSEYLLQIGTESRGQVFDILAVGYIAGEIAKKFYPNDPAHVARVVAGALSHDVDKADTRWTEKKTVQGYPKPICLLSAEYRIPEEEFRGIVMQHPEKGALYWMKYFFEEHALEFDLNNQDTADTIKSIIFSTNFHHSFSPFKFYPLIDEVTYRALKPLLLDVLIVQIADQICARNHQINVRQSTLSDAEIARSYYVGTSDTQKLTPWSTYEALVIEYTGVLTIGSDNILLKMPEVQNHLVQIFEVLREYLSSDKLNPNEQNRMIDFNHFQMYIDNLHPVLQDVVKNKLGMFIK
jgi:hypothetical protein